MSITIQKKGFLVDGQPRFFTSGEFHYFRVPKADWRRRMRLFREAGGEAIATYIPWLIHEPTEGDIRFDDCPERDLSDFLRMAGEEGLKALVRPGPYQYSELRYGGLPRWVLTEHPEALARTPDGKPLPRRTASYMHPVFLRYAERYIRRAAQVIRPFLSDRGGPVELVQVDNELMGIQVWQGAYDQNAETFGFGREDGYCARFLQKKYGTVEQMNRAYETHYEAFSQVWPIAEQAQGGAAVRRRLRDQELCYLENCYDYLDTVSGWLREEGITVPLCHNSGNGDMNALFEGYVRRQQQPFLLGSDHYYTLNQSWAQNNPTPHYALNVQLSMATMRAMGMPPTVLEMPGGSPSDTPPILKEDLLACYMTNLAMGMRGVNYYVYTGGPNVQATAQTCDVYDYNALVHADGTKNETFEAMERFHRFLQQHQSLSQAVQVASVQLGYLWEDAKEANLTMKSSDARQTIDYLKKGLMYSLQCGQYGGEYVCLNCEELDVNRPLLVAVSGRMSAPVQARLIDFMRAGGKLLLTPAVPEQDEEGMPCTLLRDYLGGYETERCFTTESPVEEGERERELSPSIEVGAQRVYHVQVDKVYTALPDGARVLAQDTEGAGVCGFQAGNCWVLGLSFQLETFQQADMLAALVREMGALPGERLSNRHLFHTRWRLPGGKEMLFVLNLYSSPQSTDVTLPDGTGFHLDLAPMAVWAG